jgi:hypothetical protein
MQELEDAHRIRPVQVDQTLQPDRAIHHAATIPAVAVARCWVSCVASRPNVSASASRAM